MAKSTQRNRAVISARTKHNSSDSQSRGVASVASAPGQRVGRVKGGVSRTTEIKDAKAASPRKRPLKNSAEFVRIDARIPKHIKAALEEAAHIQGLSQTDFMVAVISDAANKVIQDNSIIQLCVQDQKAIVAALQNDSPSVKKYGKLRQAIRNSRKMVETS